MDWPDLESADILHGSAVALGARGLLFLGASGRGKSGQALTLMALGAELIADDRVRIEIRDGLPWLSAPPSLPPLIEARGIGLLPVHRQAGAWLTGVVDLDRPETERLPPERSVSVHGVSVPLVRRVDSPHFGPALLQFLKSGRSRS